jgi:hypothetical protein
VESWTLALMDQVIISWSTVWTALPLVCSKTLLIIQHNDLYLSTSSTNSFLWSDYQIFCSEMEHMTGIDCQKSNFLANQLSRPERVLSKNDRIYVDLQNMFSHLFSKSNHSYVIHIVSFELELTSYHLDHAC